MTTDKRYVVRLKQPRKGREGAHIFAASAEEAALEYFERLLRAGLCHLVKVIDTTAPDDTAPTLWRCTGTLADMVAMADRPVESGQTAIAMRSVIRDE